MSERLTGRDKEGTYLKLKGSADDEKVWCVDDREFINARYGKQLLDKLCAFEDVMEKYGIENIDELYVRLDKTLVEWRNEVDRDFKEMLEHDRDTWKKACELACECIKGKPTEEFRINHSFRDIVNYFYKQAKMGGG